MRLFYVREFTDCCELRESRWNAEDRKSGSLVLIAFASLHLCERSFYREFSQITRMYVTVLYISFPFGNLFSTTNYNLRVPPLPIPIRQLTDKPVSADGTA